MMNRNVVIAMLLLALSNVTYAQIADVTGIGEDSDSALRDAKRNAVEQVVGTYINSETLVSQASWSAMRFMLNPLALLRM